MAKRAAENQLTKDGADGDDSGEEGQGSTGQGATAPVEGRVIRGLPKRKGLGGAQPAAPPTAGATPAAPVNPFASFGAVAPSAPAAPKPAFSFGAPAASAPAPASPFSFGGPTSGASAPPKAAAPFSGFSFASSGSSTAVGVGGAAAPEPAKTSAFGGFSFGQPAKAPQPPVTTASEGPKAASSPFSGFSFAPKPAAGNSSASAADKPAASTSTPAAAAPLSEAPASAAPKPFSGFSFGSGSTTKQAETSSSKVYPDLPKEDAPVAASDSSAKASTGMPKPPLPGSFSFGNPSTTSTSSKPFVPPATKLDGMPAPPSGGFNFGASGPAKSDGLPKASTSAFSFGPATSSSAGGSAPAASNNGFSFGSKVAAAPSSSSTAPNGSALATSVSTPVPSSDLPGSDNAQYLTSVRGLNHSLAQALAHKVQLEPFCNLGEVLDRLRDEYNQHLAGIQDKAGIEGPKRKRQRTNGAGTSSGLSSTLNARPQAVQSAVGSAGRSAESLTSKATASSSVSAKPVEVVDENMDKTTEIPPEQARRPESSTASPAVSLFRDILKQSSAGGESSSSAPADTVMNSPGTPAGKYNENSGASDSANKRKSAIFSITPTVKTAGSSSTTPSGTPSKPSAVAPAIFNLGSGGSPASASQAFGMPQRPRTVSTGFSFGSPAQDKASTAETSGSAKPAFSFGSGSSTFSFGQPAAKDAPTTVTSARNPFAATAGAAAPAPFTFGAPAAAQSTPAATPSAFGAPAANPFAPSSTPAFSFGAASSSASASAPAAASTPPAAAAPASAASQDKEDADATEAPADQGPDLSKVIGPAKGEEDEDTVWQSTARLLRRIEKDGKPQWGETQDIYIKINRLRGKGGEEDEGDATLMRRVIVRNVATGKLILNFSLKNLLALAPMTKQSAVRISIPNDEKKIEMYLFAFSKEENAPAKAAGCLRAIQKERRGLGLSDFSQLP